jgi:hypothetical protein
METTSIKSKAAGRTEWGRIMVRVLPTPLKYNPVTSYPMCPMSEENCWKKQIQQDKCKELLNDWVSKVCIDLNGNKHNLYTRYLFTV